MCSSICATGWVLQTAFALNAMVLAALATMKWQPDPLIVVGGIVGMALVFLFVRMFLAHNPVQLGAHDHP